MSFGTSIGDAVLVVQLAWKATQNARQACGEYDELTQQVSTLHTVLQRFQKEAFVNSSDVSTASSNDKGDPYKEELQAIVGGCNKVLGTLDKILRKYNGLSEQERGGKMLWKKVRFGNGEMADLGDLRSKVVYYTSLMTLFLNMRSTGSIGRVEQQMNDAGNDLRDIKRVVNSLAATQMSQGLHEGSILSSYTNDDKSAWKEIRRELRHKHGFHDAELRKYRALIVDYLRELGDRGVLDEKDEYDRGEDGEPATVGLDNKGTDVMSESVVHGLPTIPNRELQYVDSGVADKAYEKLQMRVASATSFNKELANEGQDVAKEAAAFKSLKESFDRDYLPKIQDFLWAPPKNEEANEEIHKKLCDELLAEVWVKIALTNLMGDDENYRLNREKLAFKSQVERLLSTMDEAAKENTTEWLVQLGKDFYNTLVMQVLETYTRPIRDERDKKEISAISATMERQISQFLIRLDDIDTNGSPGLSIMKAHLKWDLRATEEAVTLSQKDDNLSWIRKDRQPAHPARQAARVKLEFDPDHNVFTSRNYANIDILRPSDPGWTLMKQSLLRACVSCRHMAVIPYRNVFSCEHIWCDTCLGFLISNISYPVCMAPVCCTNEAITLHNIPGEIWLQLHKEAKNMQRAYASIPTIEFSDNEEIIQDFLESGKRLIVRCKTLIDICKEYIRRTPPSGNVVGFSIIRRQLTLAELEKQMQSDGENLMRVLSLWNLRFEANCNDILEHPSAG